MTQQLSGNIIGNSVAFLLVLDLRAGGTMSRILVIDDDDLVRDTIQRFLESDRKYEVTTAANGKTGLKAALRSSPELILLDIVMPGMNGFEVLKALKEQEKTCTIPVIMLTGVGAQDFISEAMQEYAEEYIMKPCDKDTLESKIARVLSRHGKLTG